LLLRSVEEELDASDDETSQPVLQVSHLDGDDKPDDPCYEKYSGCDLSKPSQPGKLSFASPGVGTSQHIAGELLKSLAGVDIVHVPYRGAVLTDVISGRVTMTLMNMGAILPLVRDGKLRGLAVTSLKRSPIISELPTLAESGFPDFEAISWFGLLAPAGTPAAVVSKVHADIVQIAEQADVRERIAQLGLEVSLNSPEEFAVVIRSDTAKWAKVIRAANIKAE